jgi:hypothetical protein
VPDGFLELTPDMEVHEPKKSHSAIIGCMIFAVGLTLIGCGVGTAAWLGYLPKHLALSKLFGKATAAETTVSPNSEEPTPAEPMP